jgi:hypothetical protein
VFKSYKKEKEAAIAVKAPACQSCRLQSGFNVELNSSHPASPDQAQVRVRCDAVQTAAKVPVIRPTKESIHNKCIHFIRRTRSEQKYRKLVDNIAAVSL